MMSVCLAWGRPGAMGAAVESVIIFRRARWPSSGHVIGVREENRAKREQGNGKRQERLVQPLPSRGEHGKNDVDGKENAYVARQSFQAPPRQVKQQRRYRVSHIGRAQF